MTVGALSPSIPPTLVGDRVLERLAAGLAPTFATAAIIALIRPWRGVDLTDEMMYLLAANSGPAQFIHSPWGWHTAPLLRLAGHGVGWFRVLGVVGLSLAAIVLVLAARSFVASRAATAVGQQRPGPVEVGLLSSGAVLWAGLFYNGLLRSPGHNWVAVVGLTVAAAGLLRNLAATSPGGVHRSVMLLTAGLMFAAPARPGSVMIAGVIVVGAILAVRSVRAALRVVALGAGYGTAGILLLVLAGVWPMNFIALFLRALRTPPLVEKSQVSTAFLTYARFPLDWLRAIMAPRAATVLLSVLVLGGLILLALSVRGPEPLRGRLDGPVRSARVLPVLALALIALIGSRAPALGFLGYAPLHWGASLMAAILGGGFLMAWRQLLPGTAGSPTSIQTAGIASALLAIAAANGLGTAGSVVGLTSNATGIAAVALLILTVHGQDEPRVRTRTAALWATSGAVAAGVILSASSAVPYRMAPLDEQVHAVRVLDGELLVDAATRDRFVDIRTTAAAGGFQEGDRLIPLTLPWSTFPPVALSAEVMPTLVPTIFQYGRSVEMGEFNLQLLDRSWDDAWVIVDRDRRTGRYERIGWQIAGIEQLIPLGTGRSFPEDYACAAEGDTVQIWRPVRTYAGPALGACEYVPSVP